MGAFTILFVVVSIFYAIENQTNMLVIFGFGVFLLSYVVPLIVNFNSLKVADFCKGVVYAIYLSPTYVNIFTIFAISNIHDVSWGSRPATTSAKVKAAAARKDDMYKNYRSTFLIVWVAINVGVGSALVYVSRSGQDRLVQIVAVGLAGVTAFKLVFSLVHLLTGYYHHCMIQMYLSRHKKKVKLFAHVKEQNKRRKSKIIS